MDGSGNAIAVWGQYDGTRENVWFNRYSVGIGWDTAALLNTEDVSAVYATIAGDRSGNAIAAWSSDGIWSKRYVAGQGWGEATRISTDPAAEGPYAGSVLVNVSVDGAGNAIAAWLQTDNMLLTRIASNRYVVGQGWGTPTMIGGEPATQQLIPTAPKLVTDDAGNAIASWGGGRGEPWFNRYEVGIGWSTAAKLDPNDGNLAGAPAVGINAAGAAIAAWSSASASSFRWWGFE
jgi:hypothetical protein